MEVPPIIHLQLGFSIKNYPAIGGSPILGKPQLGKDALLVGGFNPSEKTLVSWDDYLIYYGKIKTV